MWYLVDVIDVLLVLTMMGPIDWRRTHGYLRWVLSGGIRGCFSCFVLTSDDVVIATRHCVFCRHEAWVIDAVTDEGFLLDAIGISEHTAVGWSLE